MPNFIIRLGLSKCQLECQRSEARGQIVEGLSFEVRLVENRVDVRANFKMKFRQKFGII